MPNPLAAYRERHSISEAELARTLEISRSFLHRIETGERMPGPKVLRAIKDKLGIEPSEMRPADAALYAEAAE